MFVQIGIRPPWRHGPREIARKLLQSIHRCREACLAELGDAGRLWTEIQWLCKEMSSGLGKGSLSSVLQEHRPHGHYQHLKNSQLSRLQGENTLMYSNLMHDYFEKINFILLPLVMGLMFLANWNSGSCLFISVCGISLAPWLHSRTPEWRSKRCNRSLGQNIPLPLPHRPLFPWSGNACTYLGIPILLTTTLLGSCLLDHPESCWFFPHVFALWER